MWKNPAAAACSGVLAVMGVCLTITHWPWWLVAVLGLLGLGAVVLPLWAWRDEQSRSRNADHLEAVKWRKQVEGIRWQRRDNLEKRTRRLSSAILDWEKRLPASDLRDTSAIPDYESSLAARVAAIQGELRDFHADVSWMPNPPRCRFDFVVMGDLLKASADWLPFSGPSEPLESPEARRETTSDGYHPT